MDSQKKYLVHPQYIIMFLVLAGVTALFLGFSGAYLYNRVQQDIPPIALPPLFYWNSLILVASSFSLWWAKQAYLEDKTDSYSIALSITFVLTLLFLFAQILAWNQLRDANIALNHSTTASYLYVISFLHFAHVIAGIPFLAYFVFVAFRKMKSPMTVLLYFTDPDKKRSLDLLNIYWHFLDGLWIYLVIFFLLNYLI